MFASLLCCTCNCLPLWFFVNANFCEPKNKCNTSCIFCMFSELLCAEWLLASLMETYVTAEMFVLHGTTLEWIMCPTWLCVFSSMSKINRTWMQNRSRALPPLPKCPSIPDFLQVALTTKHWQNAMHFKCMLFTTRELSFWMCCWPNDEQKNLHSRAYSFRVVIQNWWAWHTYELRTPACKFYTMLW